MIGIIVENSMELSQVVGIYHVVESELKHIADRLYEQGRIIDYEVVIFDDIEDLNEYLRNNIILPDDE